MRHGLSMEGLFLLRAESSPTVPQRNRNSGEGHRGRGKDPSQLVPRDREKEGRMMGRKKGRVDSERNH